MDMYSRVFEMTLGNQSRRPMTPDEMMRFYVGNANRSQSRSSRLGVALAKAVKGLEQRLHVGIQTPTAKPAYRQA